MTEQQVNCPRCHGTGKNPERTTNTCLCCNGNGQITKTKYKTLARIRHDLAKRMLGG